MFFETPLRLHVCFLKPREFELDPVSEKRSSARYTTGSAGECSGGAREVPERCPGGARKSAREVTERVPEKAPSRSPLGRFSAEKCLGVWPGRFT